MARRILTTIADPRLTPGHRAHAPTAVSTSNARTKGRAGPRRRPRPNLKSPRARTKATSESSRSVWVQQLALSTYWSAKRRPPSARSRRDSELKAEIVKASARPWPPSRQPGTPRVYLRELALGDCQSLPRTKPLPWRAWFQNPTSNDSGGWVGRSHSCTWPITARSRRRPR